MFKNSKQKSTWPHTFKTLTRTQNEP